MKNWLSVYLFNPGSFDLLLADFVYPLKEEFYADARVHSFFFIRYMDPGPHIRLRLLVENGIMQQLIAESVQTKYLAYVSQVISGKAGGNSIEFVPYEPELARYGGIRAISLAERMFESSSQAVLSWLSVTKEPGTHRLTTALVLHTCFTAACVAPQSQISFLEDFTRLWLPTEHPTLADAASSEDGWIDFFEQRYQQYLPGILPYITHYYHAAISGRPTGQDWLDRFLSETSRIHAIYANTVHDQITLLDIYHSLMHMTNNRLGIANHDEPFLSYILSRSLSQICDEQAR